MKILLVDDDAFLRDMYALKFTECGHVIDAVDNATAALAKLDQVQDFEVILTDMIMPGLSGTQLIYQARERFPKMTARFIVLSNQGQPEDIEEATAAGAHGYIIKAESIPSDVVKKVEALMAQPK